MFILVWRKSIHFWLRYVWKTILGCIFSSQSPRPLAFRLQICAPMRTCLIDGALCFHEIRSIYGFTFPENQRHGRTERHTHERGATLNATRPEIQGVGVELHSNRAPYQRSRLCYNAVSVCLSVCVCVSVACNVYIVPKRWVLPKNSLKTQIGNSLWGWGIEWPCDRWPHVTLKGKVVIPKRLEPNV